MYEARLPDTWNEYVRNCVAGLGLPGDLVFLMEGPSSRHPEANHRMEIIEAKGHSKMLCWGEDI